MKMCTSEKTLPPNVSGKTQGCLEIEVVQFNFLCERDNQTRNKKNKKPSKSNSNSKQSDIIKDITAKFVWCGESIDNAASIKISCVKEGKKKQQQAELKKLRYNICSLALFLDYLHTCAPIEILIFSSCSNLQLGQATFRPSDVLLRKYASNYTNGCSFDYNSKIYAIYNNGSPQKKAGGIQLRFRMLFAPSAKNAKTALQEQMTTLQREHKAQSIKSDGIATASGQEVQEQCKVEKPIQNSATKSEEIVEAMKKLDANLVAYLAKDDMPEKEQFDLKELNSRSNINHLIGDLVEDRDQQMLQVFEKINGIKLQLEALTLQPEGTKRMELLQSEIRPIFTVECQLSNELIINVPRYDMFHVMQFESEKFHSLTQCTRFGQEAERKVKLILSKKDDKGKAPNFGRIHFVVWWREPGTCLNEMLGMGILEIEELYNASLLEQCKCIAIKRHDTYLASLYLKISLLLEPQYTEPQRTEMNILQELLNKTNIKQCNDGNSDDEKKQTSQNNEQNENAEDQSNDNPNIVDNTNPAQNNNFEIESTNFSAETSKVRLLKGYLYANETRSLEQEPNVEYILVCRRFWHEEIATVAAAVNETEINFNFQEQFSVINDEKFLSRVDKQFLQLEVWRRLLDDGNANNLSINNANVTGIGMLQLPLHQFFIAYRDSAITNHVCKGKLPVISVDAWVPLTKFDTNEKVGELKCLLAIGSEEQIVALKDKRGFNAMPQHLTTIDISHLLLPVQPNTNTTDANMKNTNTASAMHSKLKKVSDLLDMLQRTLTEPPAAPPPDEEQLSTQKSASVATPLVKPLQQTNMKSFTFNLYVQRATGLPLNPAKGKKGSKRHSTSVASKRFPPNEAPNTYVTFQADEGYGKLYKSHEGMVYATNVFQNSTKPEWQQHFRISATTDYLTNPQKMFILKIWKKASTNNTQQQLQPTPMEDAIIGFAALDLTVFSKGLHIGGSFNIVDFNGRINGQIEVQCQPIEDVRSTSQSNLNANVAECSTPLDVDAVIDQFENSLALSHMNLGQAIKRKFTELEEISQRLRTRLCDVTGEEFKTNFDISDLDNWQSFDDTNNDKDAFIDEFEHDINTMAVEQTINDSELSHEAQIDEKFMNMISSAPNDKHETKK